MKRPAVDPDVPVFERLELTPLGGGNEVGRSCLILRYKGKTIMLDCGILPSFQGLESLPWLGELDPATVDVVFITHFHLDHAAALPHFTERLAGFRGRIFATHATIACMKLMLSDFVRVTAMGADDPHALYNEGDIDRCIARMEAVDFKQRMGVGGLQFMFFNAGHVLGAAMVLMEIAGVRILYTGDYSCEEDRHLMAAEVPKQFPPDILIVEATYGMQVHESRGERERRFTDSVERVVRRGGRCLIPVFALGRAQELLLILDEYWAARPELQRVPIFFSSKLASRSLEVYRTYISHMNDRLQSQMGDRNPWDFRFVRSIARPDEFRDEGPCVVLASPGMLQSGFSRSLFDRWAEDGRNGVVLAGYSVEGTLARRLESNPPEVESLAHRKLVRRIGVERVSFSAHADSLQTMSFVDALSPPCVILVHGEKSEMRKLKDGLSKRLEATNGQVFMPPNGSTVTLNYQETRLVKAMGSLAARRLAAGVKISGVLVHRNFEYVLVAPVDLPKYTPLATHTLAQKQHVPFRSSFALLHSFVASMFASPVSGWIDEDGNEVPPPRVHTPAADGTRHDDAGALDAPPTSGSSASSSSSSSSSSSASAAAAPASSGIVPYVSSSGSSSSGRPPRRFLRVGGGSVTVVHAPPDRVLLTWTASPTSDMVADSLVALIGQAEVSQAALRASSKPCGHGHSHAEEADDAHAAAASGGGCGPELAGAEGEGGAGWSGLGHGHYHPTHAAGGGRFAWSDLLDSDDEDEDGQEGALPLHTALQPPSHADRAASASPEARQDPSTRHVLLLGEVLLSTFVEQYGAHSVAYTGPTEHAARVQALWPAVAVACHRGARDEAAHRVAPPTTDGSHSSEAPSATDADRVEPSAGCGPHLAITVCLDGLHEGRVVHGAPDTAGTGSAEAVGGVGWRVEMAVPATTSSGAAAGGEMRDKLEAALRRTLALARAALQCS